MEDKTKGIIDAMIETQNKTMNNWFETTQKAQKAVLGGQSVEKGSDLYKEWAGNQMNILTNATNDIKNKTAEATENAAKAVNPQDFFKNWYENQTTLTKQIMDANQNFYNSFLNFGKTNNDLTNSYTKMNDTLTSLYNNWQNTLTAAVNNLTQNLPGANQTAFKNIFDGTTFYNQVQDIFNPWFKSLTTGNYNPENLKTLFEPTKVKELTEKIFEAFFKYPNTKEMTDAYAKNYETFFANNTTYGKEFMQNWRSSLEQMPNLVSGDFAKLTGIYNQYNQLLQTTYGPFMRLVAQSPEKRNAEFAIEATDSLTKYALKQAQLQYLLYTATQQTIEKTTEFLTEKIKNNTEVKSAQQLFSEWVTVAEKVYLDLFNSDEYSKLKGDLLSEGMSLKKLVEKQIENYFENTPFIFRSEMDELYKTIHDLKKKVRDLETRLAVTNISTTELDEEKTSKTTGRKKQ